MDRLSDLPEHILQKILCFLSQHEAARTSALSKRWRALWITRPKLDFSEASFKRKKQEFLSLVNNTLQRYHHQNLSLDEFHLSLSVAEYTDKSFSLLEEWLPRLTHLGVKEFYLSFDFKVSIEEKYRPLPWPQEFRNLNKLDLTSVGLLVPDRLSSCKFPCLQYLTLQHCYGFEESHLFFDAPKIVHFVYGGKFIPSISFAPTSSSWNSYPCILSWPELSNDIPSWLLKLSELLKSLSQSTISLFVFPCCRSNHYQHFEEDGLVVQQPVEVEWLQLCCLSLSQLPCLLNTLFRVCHPKRLVNINRDKDISELLCKILMQRESQSDWVRDLEDVRIEIYDKNGGKWNEVTVSEYLMPNEKTGEASYRYPLFRLKWREA